LLLPGRAALAGGDAAGRLRFVKCRASAVQAAGNNCRPRRPPI